MLEKTVRIVDTETGQLTKEEVKAFDIFNEKGLLFKTNQHFIKSFQGIKLSEVLTNKIDIANMYILAENMYKDTNMIAVKRGRKVTPATISDMSILIDTCERRTKIFIDKMCSINIIAKDIVVTNGVEETQYYINPLYFMSNKRLTPALYIKFRTMLDPYLSAWARITLNEASNLKDM